LESSHHHTVCQKSCSNNRPYQHCIGDVGDLHLVKTQQPQVAARCPWQPLKHPQPVCRPHCNAAWTSCIKGMKCTPALFGYVWSVLKQQIPVSDRLAAPDNRPTDRHRVCPSGTAFLAPRAQDTALGMAGPRPSAPRPQLGRKPASWRHPHCSAPSATRRLVFCEVQFSRIRFPSITRAATPSHQFFLMHYVRNLQFDL